ncbi:hypothetical protein [Streptomyces sp. NPDC002599]|uniref:hypothetical protein n=1 Tax=Streptomyces sp. NPDC002599 TaxID=3154421 RepID=UPI003329473D
MNITRHRVLVAGAAAFSVALAVVIGVRLSGYGVPLSLLLACCLSCATTFSSLLLRVISAWSTTTHRCTRPGCDFSVSLTHTDSGENRRWQEIAAHHPHRTH